MVTDRQAWTIRTTTFAPFALSIFTVIRSTCSTFTHKNRGQLLPKIVGLKYFNVFGPNEHHKGDMRSLVCKAYDQIVDYRKDPPLQKLQARIRRRRANARFHLREGCWLP